MPHSPVNHSYDSPLGMSRSLRGEIRMYLEEVEKREKEQSSKGSIRTSSVSFSDNVIVANGENETTNEKLKECFSTDDEDEVDDLEMSDIGFSILESFLEAAKQRRLSRNKKFSFTPDESGHSLATHVIQSHYDKKLKDKQITNVSDVIENDQNEDIPIIRNSKSECLVKETSTIIDDAMKWHGKRPAVQAALGDGPFDRPMSCITRNGLNSPRRNRSSSPVKKNSPIEDSSGGTPLYARDSPIHGLYNTNSPRKLKEKDFVYKSPTGINDEKFDYIDTDEMMNYKLDMVVDLMRASGNTIIYSGRGISSRAGSDKFSAGSLDPKRLDMKPTKSHLLLSVLEKNCMVHHWIQPNHDRLAQKAGFPQNKVTELFGAWNDSRNPVIKDKDFGSPKAKCMNSLNLCEKNVEVCLCIGNSLCGILSDSIAQAASDAHNSLIIINPKKTPRDHLAAIRLWGSPDDILERLVNKLFDQELLENSLEQVQREGEEWQMKYPNCKYHSYEIS